MTAKQWLAGGVALLLLGSVTAQARHQRAPAQCGLLLATGHFEQAAVAGAQAVPQAYHPQFAWSCMGQADYRLGRCAAATQAFSHAYALSPTYMGRMKTALWLGLANEWLGRSQQAAMAYQQAYAMARKRGRRSAVTQAAISLAAFYGRQKNYPTALAYYQVALKHSRPDQQAVILADIAGIHAQAQEYQQSAESLAHAVALDQENQVPGLLARHEEQLAALSQATPLTTMAGNDRWPGPQALMCLTGHCLCNWGPIVAPGQQLRRRNRPPERLPGR